MCWWQMCCYTEAAWFGNFQGIGSMSMADWFCGRSGGWGNRRSGSAAGFSTGEGCLCHSGTATGAGSRGGMDILSIEVTVRVTGGYFF